jgi:hypothetical protein
MSTTAIFFWAAAGSIAVDVVTALRIYDGDKIDFPARYQHVFYYICRLVLAGIGGGLAVAYDITTPILAINIGASAPLILTSLSQGLQKGSRTDSSS